jgi:hypothetical protein
MHLTSLALTLAAAVSMVAAYPITGNNVNCRTGPGTSYKTVKTYKKGANVKLTCQTTGQSINGNNIWDKTTDGCYVADFYVRTGSNSMVVKKCGGGGGGGGGGSGGGKGKSKYQGTITRDEIIARGKYWTSKGIPYSMGKSYPDSSGRRYRTDCSGFVSMALHALAPGHSTVTLGNIAKQIAWKDLKPGDFVGTLGAGTGGADGHVVLFLKWADKAKKNFHTLECRGGAGCLPYKRAVSYPVGRLRAKPYRYKLVKD